MGRDSEMTRRQTIPSVSVAVVRGDTVLLVKRAKPPSRGVYAFPGGKVETNETLEAAANRSFSRRLASARPICVC